MVLNQKTQRQTGREAQLGNISGAMAVSDIIRTTLGPRSMLKMLLDPMGGIVMTNDGNCILREVDVSHPAAKSMIELARAQDEEVGDGTTSVIILSGEMLAMAEPFLRRNIHPTVIVGGYNRALQFALEYAEKCAITVDVKNSAIMKKLVESCIGTKFSSRWNEKMVGMALEATLKVRPPDTPPDTPLCCHIHTCGRVRPFTLYSLLTHPLLPPGRLRGRRAHGGRHQALRQDREDPRRRDRRLQSNQRRHVQQGRYSPQDASPH